MHQCFEGHKQVTVFADAVRGKAGGMVNNVQIFRATPQRIRGSPVDNLYGVCPPPFSVWFPGKTMSRFGLSSA